MKQKIMTALTVVLAMFLALTVYAFNQSSEKISVKTSANCCTKKDSCAMKDKQNNTAGKSCCAKADCCQDGVCKGDGCKGDKCGGDCQGDNCRMKNDGTNGAGKKCCKGGDSCPVKKDAEKQTTSVPTRRLMAVSHGIN